MSTLTSDISKVPSSFPTVRASVGVHLVFIQAGFAVHPPTTLHLVWGGRYMKTDLTDQFVWWCVHKLTVIPTSLVSHLLHLLVSGEHYTYISKTAK